MSSVRQGSVRFDKGSIFVELRYESYCHYFNANENHSIRKLTPKGIISTITYTNQENNSINALRSLAGHKSQFGKLIFCETKFFVKPL